MALVAEIETEPGQWCPSPESLTCAGLSSDLFSCSRQRMITEASSVGGALGKSYGGSVVCGRRSRRLDFGAQHWYTRATRARNKLLILLVFLSRRGNPSLSATTLFSFVSDCSILQV